MPFDAINWTKHCLNYLYLKQKAANLRHLYSHDSEPSQQDIKPLSNNNGNPSAHPEPDQIQELWIPMIRVFSDLCGDSRQKVQEDGMTSLFQILKEFGHLMKVENWKYIFQSVLRPLFDEIQFTFQSRSQSSKD